MDSQPTGGNGMEVDNLPENMEGGKPTDSSKGGKETEKVQLSDRQKELLKKKIQKQKDFMNGDVRKKTISKKDNDNLSAIDESGSEMKSVGQNVDTGWGRVTKGTQCIVVKKLTQSLLESEMFPMTHNNHWNIENDGAIRRYYEKQVAEGIRIGTILGKKLQVRGEDRNTIFNRQKHGKIDRRMISSLGFGNENVFQYIETDSYKKANLHISIDASGSMGGDKWTKTLTNVVALCKAVDMIQNLSIQVSFRTTSNNNPYIVMAYDSRTDKFSKVKQMFPSLDSGGTTPEGLCFEAIMDNFLPANNDMDSYFLNISDGEPYFGNNEIYYSGEVAFEHTRKMVKKIEGMGVKTLSYYVESWMPEGSEPSTGFKRMYGKGAKLIDVTNVSQITKTMNQLFLEK
jgi:Mg-chelatase subunit ChlD